LPTPSSPGSKGPATAALRARFIAYELDAIGSGFPDGVRVAHRELEVAALLLSSVTDAVDFEAFFESARYTFDHVGDQAPDQAVQRSDLTRLALPPYMDRVIGMFDCDSRRDHTMQLAPGAVDVDGVGSDTDADVIGNRYGR